MPEPRGGALQHVRRHRRVGRGARRPDAERSGRTPTDRVARPRRRAQGAPARDRTARSALPRARCGGCRPPAAQHRPRCAECERRSDFRGGGAFAVRRALQLTTRIGGFDDVWRPAVRAAVELLTSDAVEHIGRCADDSCGWLFLDTTRSRTRRWCDMKVCGNRNKVRRFRSDAAD